MSGVVTAIGLAVGATAAAAATVGTIILVSVVLMVVSIGFSVYSMMSMKRFNDNAKLKDRTHVVRSSIEPRAYIYGQAMVSGPLVYVLSTGSNNSLLYMVVALAGHQVQAIGDVYLGDKLSTDPVFGVSTPEQGHWQDIYETDYEGNSVYVGQEWIIDVPASTCSRVQITKYLGTADQLADSELISASGGQWTSEHRLRGVAYIIVKLEYDSKSFPNGIPNVKAVVTGNNQIYDPRTDTYGYSNNWGLCMYDYLSKGYGIKCDGDEINLTQAILAADISDEDVVLAAGGTEKRFTCNGVFSCEEKPITIMQKLLSGALGSIVWSQGQYFINPAVYKTPETYVITESDIVDSITVTPEKSTRDKFNIVKGVFIDPTQYWKPIDFPQVKNSAAITKDGQELFEDITLDFTTSSATAQRLAKIHLERELQSIVASFTGKLTLFGFKPGDVIPVSLSCMGWSEKLFKIVNWELTENANVSVVLREESEAIYDWADGEETVVDPAPNTNLPDPFTVPVPANIELNDELVLVQGGVVSKLTALLSPSPDIFVSRYEVEARRQGDIQWSEMGSSLYNELVGVVSGNLYDVRARAFNMLGIASQYISKTHLVIGLSAPPPDVNGARINCIDTQAHLSWTPVSDIGLSHYSVKFSPLIIGASWSSSVALVPQVSGNSITVPAMVGSYLIKAIRYGGSESTNAAMVTSSIAGIAGLNAVELIEPAPLWNGTHTNTVVVDGSLRLNSADTLSDWIRLSVVKSLAYGLNGYAQSGSYQSDTIVDLGLVYTSRLTAQLNASGSNTLNVMSVWSTLSSVVRLSGAEPGEWEATLQVSVTQDDPSANNWSAWQEFIVGDYSARAFRFRLLLYSYRPEILVQIPALSINIDMPDRIISAQDITCPAAGMRIDFVPAFRSLKALAIDGQDMLAGDYKTVTGKDETGYTLRFFNSTGTGVERTFDAIATGYGQEV